MNLFLFVNMNFLHFLDGFLANKTSLTLEEIKLLKDKLQEELSKQSTLTYIDSIAAPIKPFLYHEETPVPFPPIRITC